MPAAATATTPDTTATDDGTADDTGSGEDDGTGAEDDGGAGDDGGGGGATECSDGVDNDGDGKIDFGNDPGCASADDDSEDDAVSLGGKELPFTGTDVVVLGLAGLLLLASGIALRGPSRRRELGS